MWHLAAFVQALITPSRGTCEGASRSGEHRGRKDEDGSNGGRNIHHDEDWRLKLENEEAEWVCHVQGGKLTSSMRDFWKFIR